MQHAKSEVCKLRLYQSCILSTLLYGSECGRMIESHLNKLSTYHSKNLKRILQISGQDHLQPTSRSLQLRQERKDKGDGLDM